MISLDRTPIRLQPSELRALERAVALQLPAFVPYLATGGLAIHHLVQPFFTTWKVIEVGAANVFPAKQIHVSLSPQGQVGVLTANLAVFNAMVTADPPPRLAYVEEAKVYLNWADFWSTESDLGELVVSSVGEIPLLDELEVEEVLMMEGLAEDLDGEMGPPMVTQDGPAFELVKWVVTACTLLRRTLRMEPSGRVSRQDEVFDRELPMAEGRIWAMKNGRLVPVG